MKTKKKLFIWRKEKEFFLIPKEMFINSIIDKYKLNLYVNYNDLWKIYYLRRIRLFISYFLIIVYQ